MRKKLARILFACTMLCLPPAARAELDCIVPTREEGFSPKTPGANAVRRAAHAVAAITQKNNVFMQGNKPVRVRTTINYLGDDRTAASVITTAYNQKAWLAGGCKISKFSDRGGGLSDGTIAIYINDPHAMLSGQLGDGELRAHAATKRQGTLAGHPVYAVSGNQDNPKVLLSKLGYEPWVPVNLAEVLAWRERDLSRSEADFRRAQQPDPDELNEAKIETIYQDIKKVDPATAEKTRAQMLAMLPKLRRDATRGNAVGGAFLAKHRAAFDAYRASLTPAQLAGPGTHTAGTMSREGLVQAGDPQGSLLAKADPAYWRRDPNRIHLIAVAVVPHPKASPQYAWAQASYEALDYAALAALLE